MTPFKPPSVDLKLVKELTTFSDADIAVMEEQAVEQLTKAKRTRFKYRRELQQALRDYAADCLTRQFAEPKPNKPNVPTTGQKPLNGAQAIAAVCGGVVFAAGSLALFLLTLWIMTGGPFR